MSKRSMTVPEMMAAVDPVPEILSLRKENSELRSALREKRRQFGEESEVIASIREEVQKCSAPKVIYQGQSKKGVKKPVVLVVHLTDWHIGLSVDPEEIEDFSAYNHGIAVERINELQRKLIDWTTLHRHNYVIEEMVVLGTGDWISGDIHDELIRTNEFPAPVQAVKAGYLLGAFLAAMSPHFKRVRAELVTMDNHGRLTKKPQKAEGGYNNWGFIVSTIAKEHVASCKNVVANIWPMASKVIEVAGWRYLCGHGNGILGTWGIPYYGIDRRKQREAMARMNMAEDKHFHKLVIGHFHSALNHEHWMVGGSLSGTDANDHTEGRHSIPHQTSWLVHPTHGEFDYCRWYL